ncbi:MAG: nitroreductase family protein [Alphaproteobacteria bacterium]|nr:nitroreductase family protein [Alphaproteobacteria bacterium]
MAETDPTRAAIAARYAQPRDSVGPAAEDARLLPFLTRSVCRDFKPDPVPEPLLASLLACAQSAPSKSDLQQYSIIVIDDPELRGKINALDSIQSWAEAAPLMLIFVADSHRGRKICEDRGYDYAMATVDTLVNATGDAAIALSTFLLAAERVGLGCCPLSVIRNHLDAVSGLLELPDHAFPFAGLVVGYPNRFFPTSPRLPQSVAVHRNRYREPAAEDLAAYDATRPKAPEKQMHTDRYGTVEPYGWCENTARRLSVRERGDFKDFLIRKKFGFD